MTIRSSSMPPDPGGPLFLYAYVWAENLGMELSLCLKVL